MMFTTVLCIGLLVVVGIYANLFYKSEEEITNYLNEEKTLEENAKIKYTDEDYKFTFKLSK